MTRAVVRAMDVVQEVCESNLQGREHFYQVGSNFGRIIRQFFIDNDIIIHYIYMYLNESI